ncbi:uncharacterized protein EV154DRAFT_34774 [Mucor mucedo]|uniref:uncharacterized protein n=1 Tax=Mucor mucedo TaxID=29922 RepID=UPI00221E8CDB|nr:uncharacterized protein EV154DRAFT_34774 [Mucor mucedo]KAI7895160.1 hypothetical protein EV154DRAFT_34774 [Mucor mucedo]
MLASFKSGREIIKAIVVKPIPISIFSYARPISKLPDPDEDEDERYERKQAEKKQREKWEKMEKKLGNTNASAKTSLYRNSIRKPSRVTEDSQSIASNENVLTVLINELSYDMYRLIFNRILSDSKKMGPGCLSSLTEALLLLQEEGNSDLLLSSSQKLSYLEIEKDKLGVLESEISHVMNVKALKKEYISSFRNLETHAIMEQITKYSNFQLIFYKIKCIYHHSDFYNEAFNDIRKKVRRFWRLNIRNNWRKLFMQSRKEGKKLSKVCVVPLPHFNSYSNFPEDRPRNTNYGISNVNTHKDSSAFVRVALDQNSNNIFRQGDTVLEVMLQYKWREFARWRFVGICAVHVVYYISYSTGVLFAEELYEQSSERYVIKDPGQIISVTLMCLSVSLLILQEIRQFWKTHSRLDYFFSGYNWIDISAFVFPIFTLIQLICGWDNFYEVCSVSTLILWTHGILRLRVISYFGITLETIIQLSKNVAAVLFIMLLVIIAFTNAYIVLLRQQFHEYFQENYSGTFSVADNGPSGEANFADVSADNGFQDWFKAFSQVWFFVYGVWDPLNDGDAGDNKMIMCISIIFSLVTVLIFFNLVIALMASTVEEVKKRGKKVWVSHFAAVVSEIELLWCFDNSKHCRKNNPTYIYYIASYDSVMKHEEKLREETAALLKKMNANYL